MSFALSAALYTAFAPSETFPTSLAFAIALTAFPPPVAPGTIVHTKSSQRLPQANRSVGAIIISATSVPTDIISNIVSQKYPYKSRLTTGLLSQYTYRFL